MNIDDTWDDEEDRAQFAKPRSINIEAAAQKPVASAADAAKMRFFRDMVSAERRKVFEVFGVGSAALNEVRSLSDETRLFRHLFEPPAVCPKCAERAATPAPFMTYRDERDALQAKVEELEVTIAMLRDGGTCSRQCNGLIGERDSARATREDAARYLFLKNRWLPLSLGDGLTRHMLCFGSRPDEPDCNDLDAAIDAAITEAKP